MMTMREYLSTALNRKAWEENTEVHSENSTDPRSIVGPEDFVSMVTLAISIVVFLIVLRYGEFEGKYTFLKHLQVLGPAFLLFVFSINKIRVFEDARPMREINAFRILQCLGIWLNGGASTLYFITAFA